MQEGLQRLELAGIGPAGHAEPVGELQAARRVLRAFLDQPAREALARAERQLAEAKAGRSVDVIVLAERKQPRSTHVLLRGAWDKKGAKVEADGIGGLARWPEGVARDRAGMARWLVSRDNPLTARVIVNHLWNRHFGQPLVATVFDFGRKGTPPTQIDMRRLSDGVTVYAIDAASGALTVVARQPVAPAPPAQGFTDLPPMKPEECGVRGPNWVEFVRLG